MVVIENAATSWRQMSRSSTTRYCRNEESETGNRDLPMNEE